MKKLIAFVLIIILCTSVHARSSADLRKDLDALKSQADALQAQGTALEQELTANRTQTQSTIDRKFDLDRQINQTEQEIANTNAQLRQYSLLIAQKQQELEEARAAYDQLQKDHKARLRAMEEHGAVSYWSVLFQANSFSDLLDRIHMIREIAEADQRMLAQLQSASDRVASRQLQLQADQNAQQQTKVHLETLEAQLQTQRAEADACLHRLQADHDALSTEYEALAAQEAAMQAEIMAAQAAYDKALTAEAAAQLSQLNQSNPAGSAASTGSFRCPVSGAFITDAYGYRTHPVTGKKESFHTGVDFAVNMNAPIYAMAAGTVSATGNTSIYGINATLSHGNGYGSFYAHMNQCLVTAGETVTQGQLIGYAGSTGRSTGPHLHFEIYVNGATVNPMAYVSLG